MGNQDSPQYIEDLDTFLEDLIELLNVYHLTFAEDFKLGLFSHHKSEVSEIIKHGNRFSTVNKVYED